MRILFYIFNSFLIISNAFYVKKFLHIYQLKNYQNLRFLEFFSKNIKIYTVFLAFFAVFLAFLKNFYVISVFNIVIFISNYYLFKDIINSKKTPINYTKKLIRIYLLSIVLVIIPLPLYFGYVLSTFILLFSPIISNILNLYDKILNAIYIHKARKKLKSSNVKIIAITGSNGKTSVKNILAKILEKDYKVLPTPLSYNTPLGIAKFINENTLDNIDFIILEYGARRVGDIKKLCKIFGADYGIVTMVGNQHLATFKSRENIYLAKRELAKFLKEKLCVFNLDNIYTLRMFYEKYGEKVGVSINTQNGGNDKNLIYANDINIKNFLTEFNLHVFNKTYKVKTSLLGAHNVLNIVLCTALSLRLGVKIRKIVSAIRSLKFTPHRLELIKSRINIFDDSYNCSLDSAKASIDVLSKMKNKKMVVTPGIIEGGKTEYDLNFQLGKMLHIFDFVIIIGEHNKRAITDGLKSIKKTSNIFYCRDLKGAKKYFSMLNDGENLLLLNDLPDDYD